MRIGIIELEFSGLDRIKKDTRSKLNLGTLYGDVDSTLIDQKWTHAFCFSLFSTLHAPEAHSTNTNFNFFLFFHGIHASDVGICKEQLEAHSVFFSLFSFKFRENFHLIFETLKPFHIRFHGNVIVSMSDILSAVHYSSKCSRILTNIPPVIQIFHSRGRKLKNSSLSLWMRLPNKFIVKSNSVIRFINRRVFDPISLDENLTLIKLRCTRWRKKNESLFHAWYSMWFEIVHTKMNKYNTIVESVP